MKVCHVLNWIPGNQPAAANISCLFFLSLKSARLGTKISLLPLFFPNPHHPFQGCVCVCLFCFCSFFLPRDHVPTSLCSQWNLTHPFCSLSQHQSFLESDHPCNQLEKPACALKAWFQRIRQLVDPTFSGFCPSSFLGGWNDGKLTAVIQQTFSKGNCLEIR